MSGKSKIKTRASTEAMRWADEGAAEGPMFREPNASGNIFDIRMSGEADGMLAAKKIVDVMKDRGMCLVEANAPQQLVESAFYEAEALWEDGAFAPPLRVHDDRSMLEAQLWSQALKDEEKVVWIRDAGAQQATTPNKGMNALRLLAKNMSDFAGGLGEFLHKEVGVDFDRIGQAMLSCYTGDRQYALHLDNAHGGEDDGGLPDNGMRLTCTYYINLQWEPGEGDEGGLDVFLTDAKENPSSASEAKRAPKFRVAPHADSLALFLSERMAHRVVPTKGKDTRWYALTVWGLSGQAMQQMSRKLMAMRNHGDKQEDSDED